MKKIFFALVAFAMSIGIGFSSAITVSADEPPIESAPIESVESVESSIMDDSVSVEESPELNSSDGKDVTIDDVLDFAEDVADEAGVGDKWREVVTNLKNAITQEQFTISTIVDILILIVMIGYIIYKFVSNARVKAIGKNIETLSQAEAQNGKTLTAQTQALKEMAAEEEKVLQIGEGLERMQTNTALAQEYTNAALLHIVEGINFTPERKAAAIRALNKSNEILDRKGVAQDGNGKTE